MKFEIINPSDKAYIEGDFKTCALATLFFGEGKYGLRGEDNDLSMPVFLFGGADDWVEKTFKKSFEELFMEASKEEDLARALLSVKLAGKRSSLNDFSKYAHQLGKGMLKNIGRKP